MGNEYPSIRLFQRCDQVLIDATVARDADQALAALEFYGKLRIKLQEYEGAASALVAELCGNQFVARRAS